jgi:hypothetical protein
MFMMIISLNNSHHQQYEMFKDTLKCRHHRHIKHQSEIF